MVLKALLSAIIFLLEQSRQLLQLVWSLRSIKLPTIKLPSVKLPSIQLPSIKPATKPVDVWQQCQKPDREEEQAAVTPLLTRELPTRTAAPASARNQVTERTIQPRIKSTIKPAVKLPTKPAFNFNLRRVVEYGGLGVASITVLVILGLSFTTIEQAWASWRASQARFGEIKIQEDYHSASKRTWVKLEPLQVLGEHSNGLKIGASFSYPGRFLKQDPTSMTLLLTSITTESKYAKQHDLIAVADGETVKLGSMSRTAKQVEVLSDGKTEAIKSDKKNGDHVLEMLTLNVPTMTLNKIAQSKEVKMKLGDTEFALADVHLTALRDLLERAIQEPQKGK